MCLVKLGGLTVCMCLKHNVEDCIVSFLFLGLQNYKPPMPKDLPMKYNFKFLRNRPNPIGVLRSKGLYELCVVQLKPPREEQEMSIFAKFWLLTLSTWRKDKV